MTSVTISYRVLCFWTVASALRINAEEKREYRYGDGDSLLEGPGGRSRSADYIYRVPDFRFHSFHYLSEETSSHQGDYPR